MHGFTSLMYNWQAHSITLNTEMDLYYQIRHWKSQVSCFLCLPSKCHLLTVNISISWLLLCAGNVCSFSNTVRASTNRQKQSFLIILNGHRNREGGPIIGYNCHCPIDGKCSQQQSAKDFLHGARALLSWKSCTVHQHCKIEHISRQDHIARMGTLSWYWTWEHGDVSAHTFQLFLDGQFESQMNTGSIVMYLLFSWQKLAWKYILCLNDCCASE